MSTSLSQTPDAHRLVRSDIGQLTYLAPPGALNCEESVGALNQALEDCQQERSIRVVVDLANVSLLNSAALESLLDCHETFSRLGGGLRLSNANMTMLEVLALTGVSNRIPSDGAEAGTEPTARAKLVERGRLGDVLIARGLVEAPVVAKIIEQQEATGRRIGRLLVEGGHLTEEQLLDVLSEQFGLYNVRVRTGLYDPSVMCQIPLDFAVRRGVAPLFLIHGEVFLATSDPQAIPTFDAVSELLSARIRPVLSSANSIRQVLSEVDTDDRGISSLIGDLDIDTDLEVIETETNQDYTAIDQVAGESPVINLVNSLIQRAVREGVSDIHIEPSRTRSRIRFRVDGALHQVMTPPLELHPALVSRLKVMANLDIAERRLPQDGRLQVLTQGRPVDLRFSSLPGIFGEKVVLRILDKGAGLHAVRDLGMRDSVRESFETLLGRSHGLLLVTGPTGSGKTTTLYAGLHHLDSVEKSIVTIEDPVEYQIDTINQNQVLPQIGLGFATLLKHVLRQDPDIVMIGEIRERETAEIAVQAALTGHLVLSTLHTNDSAGAITRLLDMGIEPFLLSSALAGVMAQRLLRKVCPSCRTSYVAPAGSLAHLGVTDGNAHTLVEGRGCAECYDSGYRGRIPIHELLVCNDATQRLMIANPTQEELARHISELGVTTLLDSGMTRALDGATTVEEVTRAVGP